jgi:ribosomal protein S4
MQAICYNIGCMPPIIEKTKRLGRRLDAELVRRGLAPSRDKAQALIMASQVFAAGQLADKADRRIAADCVLEVRAPFPYVSRGALKIERAISAFGLDVRGKHVLDVGDLPPINRSRYHERNLGD